MLTKRKLTTGFTLIEILVVLAVLVIFLAGGVVREKKIPPSPTPTPTPISTPIITPSPTLPDAISISCVTDADCPSIACAQGCPAEGPCPPCGQYKCINGVCKRVYPYWSESLNKKIQLLPGQTVGIERTDLSLTLLKITAPPQDCFDCPTTAEVEVRSGNNSEKITFVAGVLATEKVERELSSKEIFGFKITREELRSEWIILSVQKL